MMVKEVRTKREGKGGRESRPDGNQGETELDERGRETAEGKETSRKLKKNREEKRKGERD